ncbi:MAG: hypothetical protein A2383_01685 [Candidatus Pacebacteria bacterium RIFOXYB1_FULL_39_46]|nr:MAG: hypothetical protein A2182_03200 [Candidatus Pacebacteria bacterium RIFOXYA1_FULL_38_18]OGJ37880.1 MAG: hypothetical protein A2383_01685 [Candidatus Pacebacteria bacterium RIFOXYB1_FULL_39_46]OGJ39479.1 MAG: hypothetical protein A2411_01840 [Candidatus Pacebacteria bacterium RIFOXYC1_FULL_39_21]
MSIFQIIATLFALFMLYVTRAHTLKQRFSTTETLFWYSLWSIFIFTALFPDALKGLTDLLHFSRVFDLLLVGALMILTVIVVMNYFQQRENARKWEEFIRQRAIDRIRKK